MDPTQNLFWFFRGSKISDGLRAWQIENNMTKALIVLLRRVNQEVLLRAFLSDLGISYHAGERVNFTLQRRPAIAAAVANRVVVKLLSGDAEVWDSKDRDRHGRPDATIWSNRWAVVIESKLGTDIDESQIDGHLRTLKWPKTTRRLERTWGHLHKLFKQLLPVDHLTHQDKFLTSEWCEYMEDQGMSAFNGWTSEDFRYFDLSEMEQQGFRWHLKERFKTFREQLAAQTICKSIASTYPKSKKHEWKTEYSGFWFN